MSDSDQMPDVGAALMSDSFARKFIVALGLEPTPWRMQFVQEWARFEANTVEGTPINNPLATTQPSDRELAGDPYWNTFGDQGQYHVRNYADEGAGVDASVVTIRNGYYNRVLLSLREQTIANPAGVADELSKWGTTGFAARVRDGWTPDQARELPAPAAPPETALGRLLLATYGSAARLSALEENGNPPLEERVDRMEREGGWLDQALDALAARGEELEAERLGNWRGVLARFGELAIAFGLLTEAFAALQAIAQKAGEPPTEP